MSVLLRGVKNWVFWGILRNLCSGMKTLGTLEGIYEVCMFLQFLKNLNNRYQYNKAPPINGWTYRAQIFLWDLAWPQGRFMDDRISKICLHQNSIFENFEIPRNCFIKSAKFLFVFVLQCTQRKHVHNWSRRWARSALKA